MIKAVHCFNWLPWISTRSWTPSIKRGHKVGFFKIKLNQETLKLYTSWVHWKKHCRLMLRKRALLWNKHEYQHSADIFIKNDFNSLHGTGVFLYSLKYIRKFMLSWYFQGALKKTSAMQWAKNNLIFSYLLCYLFK